MKIKKYFAIVALALFSLNTFAQSSNPEDYAKTFGSCLKDWIERPNPSNEERLRRFIARDTHPVYIEDAVMRQLMGKETLIYEDKKSLTCAEFINRLKPLAQAGEVKFSYGIPRETSDYKSSVLFPDKYHYSDTRHVILPVEYSGKINFSGHLLLTTYLNNIDRIVMLGDEDTVEEGIYQFNEKNYDKAFSIFRKLAYAHSQNYTEQHCTGVMELMGLGCKHLPSSVRQLEAKWMVCRAWEGNKDTPCCDELNKKYKLSKIERSYSRGNIADCPYILGVGSCKYVSQGMVILCKKDKSTVLGELYGFADETGKEIVKAQYTDIHHFSANGLAKVGSYNGMNYSEQGYINKRGEVVIPLVYDYCSNTFCDGVAFVFKGNKLLIINEKGEIQKDLGDGFECPKMLARGNGAFFWYRGKKCYSAKHKEGYRIYDIEGNLIAKPYEAYENLGEKIICMVKGTKNYSYPIIWQ